MTMREPYSLTERYSSMKPSDIILANAFKRGGSKDDAITAIIDYLDEQYEKSGIHDHKWIPFEDQKYIRSCEVCGIIQNIPYQLTPPSL